MFSNRLLLATASPIRRINRRLPFLERAIGLELTQSEFDAIAEACREDGLAFGAYLHWYLQKWLIARQLRGMRHDRLRTLVESLDETDYSALDRLDPDRGWLICVPHHGNYILSILALVAQLVRARQTLVFYASPERRSGNRVFDTLHACLYGEGTRATVAHDTPMGMARVLRALREGGAVILMPDAVRDPVSSLHVPFFARPLPVQLGAAGLARRTSALLIPAVWKPSTRAFSFKTSICEPLRNAGISTSAKSDRHASQLDDYRVTRTLFAHFEREMRGTVSCWQHVRSHFRHRHTFPVVDAAQLAQLSEVVFSDPRFAAATSTPFVID